MKERLVTLGLALGALILVYVLFLPKPLSADAAPARPVSGETRENGYAVIWRWLAAEHVPEVSWRARYDQLDQRFPIAKPGNVILVTLPYDNAPTPFETRMLRDWVGRGNTLIVAAALDDTPAWSAAHGDLLVEELERLTDLKATEITSAEVKAAGEKNKDLRRAVEVMLADRTSVLEPRGRHPVFAGVRSVSIASDLPSSQWKVADSDETAVLNLASIRDARHPAVWLRREGQGEIVVVAFAGVFSNHNVATADNGILLANLLAWTRRDQGTVLFDDAHQGEVDYYDAKAFFADPRLHRTLGWLVLLWLIFVLGIQRLRFHLQEWRSGDITAFIGMTGEFLASTVSARAAARRLLSNFFNEVRRRLKHPEDGTPEWSWLAAQPRLRTNDLAALRALAQRLDAGHSIDISKLHALLCQLREQIA